MLQYCCFRESKGLQVKTKAIFRLIKSKLSKVELAKKPDTVTIEKVSLLL